MPATKDVVLEDMTEDGKSVAVTVVLEWQPDEPDVGIVGGWSAYSEEAVDEDGRKVVLTEKQEQVMIERAEKRYEEDRGPGWE
jgi:hypothetical protein